LAEAVTLIIEEKRRNVWSPYQIGLLLCQLYQQKRIHSFLLRIRNNWPSQADYNRTISELILINIIKTKGNNIFYTLKGEKLLPGEVTCSIDPFSYVSHLSAMNFHNLIKETPGKTFLSTLTAKPWSQKAVLLMKKDLDENYALYRESNLPILKNIDSSNMEVPMASIYHSTKLGESKSYDYDKIRVASISRTFLDMVRRPDLCGGIKTVLKVFKEHGLFFINPLIDEIDKFGSKIEKVRAGYILENYCNFNNEIINSWEQYAMRGGSRKLDPLKEYAPTYSDRWQLSLNIH